MRKRALPVNVDKISTLWEFDDLITAKIHRFEGAEDYYAQSSSYHYLPRIKKNVLILHAYDDPFLYPDAIPRQNELPDNVQLEVHSSGGHMGFISGALPWRPRYWLEERIPPFIKALTPKGINFINHSKP